MYIDVFAFAYSFFCRHFPSILGLVISPFIVAHYDKIQGVIKREPNRPFYVLATVIISIIFYCFAIIMAAHVIVSGLVWVITWI